MDVAALVLEYIKVLVWPGIVVAAILLFKPQLDEFIGNIAAAVERVKKVSGAGGSVELAERVAQVGHQVVAAVEAETGETTETTETTEKAETIEKAEPTDHTPTDDSDFRLDDLNTGKIMRIWADIEKATQSLFERQYPSPSGRASFRVQLSNLAARGLISSDLAEAIADAYAIRNQVAHGTSNLSVDTFKDYIGTIDTLRKVMKFVSEGAL